MAADDVVVVTSDNAAEFYASRLPQDVPPPEAKQDPPAVDPKAKDDAKADDAEKDEAKDDAEDRPAKKPKPIQPRINELTWRAKSAEEREARERERADKLARELEEMRAKVPGPQRSPDDEPRPEDFKDGIEYARALAKFETRKALEQRDRETAEAAQRAREEALERAWTKRVAETADELPDYEEVLSTSEVLIAPYITQAIKESDIGPRLAYHLAQNPDVAEKLNALSPTAAVRELGKLETKLERQAKKAADDDESPPPAAPPKSKAPAPISSLRNASVPVKDESEMSYDEQVRKWRQEAKARGRPY